MEDPLSENSIIRLSKESLIRPPDAVNVVILFQMRDFKNVTKWSEYEELIRSFLVPVKTANPYIVLRELVNATPMRDESLSDFAVRLDKLLSSFIKAVQPSDFVPDEDKRSTTSFAKLAAFGAIKELMPPDSLRAMSLTLQL